MASTSADDDEALEEEREFLLGSLDDLDREYAAGDVDAGDYATLRADYTRRAAEVLRALDTGRAAPVPPTRQRPGRLLVPAGVVLLAVVAGLLMAQSSGRRGGGELTGLDVVTASARIGECVAMEGEGRDEAAADCYSGVLEELPANLDALTLRGWLAIRTGALESGLADLDAAVQVGPTETAPFLFRGIGRYRSGDPVGALADLATFHRNEPGEDEEALAAGVAATVADEALGVCVADDVAGARPALELLGCYQDALVVDPDSAVARTYLGWLLARTSTAPEVGPEVQDRARRLLDEAIDADPDLVAARVFRAALAAHTGDPELARADLAAVAELEATVDERAAAADVLAAVESGRDPMAR